MFIIFATWWLVSLHTLHDGDIFFFHLNLFPFFLLPFLWCCLLAYISTPQSSVRKKVSTGGRCGVRGGGTLNFINSVPNFPLSLAFSFSFTGRVIREESALKRLILGDQAFYISYSSLLCYEVTPTIRFFFFFLVFLPLPTWHF